MTLKLKLPPETEARLRQEAAKHGLDQAHYARLLIERQLAAERPEGRSLWETLTTEEWLEAFDRWVKSHEYVTAPPIPLEALRRENLYEERF